MIECGMRQRKWGEGQLATAVKNSTSYRQVLEKIGLKQAGGNYQQVRKYIEEYRLDVSHFTGRTWNKGLKGIGKPRIPLEKILVYPSNYQSFKLKKRLFDAGLKSKR